MRAGGIGSCGFRVRGKDASIDAFDSLAIDCATKAIGSGHAMAATLEANGPFGCSVLTLQLKCAGSSRKSAGASPSRVSPLALNRQCADLNSQETGAMNVRTISLHLSDHARFFPAAVAFAALALIGCARVTAATQIGAITVSVPTVKTVGSDSLTGAPIERSTVTARVGFDPRTLTTESGVARLREQVLEAASKACSAAFTDDYERCVLSTVQAVEPQVDEAIARSKGSSTG